MTIIILENEFQKEYIIGDKDGYYIKLKSLVQRSYAFGI